MFLFVFGSSTMRLFYTFHSDHRNQNWGISDAGFFFLNTFLTNDVDWPDIIFPVYSLRRFIAYQRAMLYVNCEGDVRVRKPRDFDWG